MMVAELPYCNKVVEPRDVDIDHADYISYSNKVSGKYVANIEVDRYVNTCQQKDEIIEVED